MNELSKEINKAITKDIWQYKHENIKQNMAEY